ncbi:unnamed protein product [Heterobilharzia americana]|nr:unnamed protein product [Heterobilharzia americana]
MDFLTSYNILGRGVSEEDTLLARSDKNAVDFAFDYSKLWCKTCKDLVLTLEKRAVAENECTRAIMKQFQILESSTANVNGAPFKKQTINLSRMMIDHCKEVEVNNTKRCRELLEVLTRQRTLFDKTRKFLKDKWKTDVKRMLDAENSLFKTKSAYYQRCQAGVKLREELASAQNFLNELSASLTQTPSNSFSSTPLSSSTLTATSTSMLTSVSGIAMNSGGNAYSSNSNLAAGNMNSSTAASSSSSSTSNQVAKQRVKVERLEKQLSDNDKKEIELMYAYREAVDIANHRLCELEKSKVEILCDTRLTITKSDEVVKDSLAELLNHLFTSRSAMIKQYETIANAYQDYVPCSDYRALVESHTQKATEFVPEKYHFDGFHESKLDTGRITSRLGKDSGDSATDSFSVHRNLLSLHSDSDSDTETMDVPSSLACRSSTSAGGGSGSGTGSNTSGCGVAGGIVSTSSNVLSTIVEFGSNLFRPDSKKSIRGKRSVASSSNLSAAAGNTTDALEAIAAQEANLEREYVAASTHGIYRVPASKAKVSNLMDLLQSNQPNSSEQINKDVDSLSQEHPLTLASLIKTQLIALPEPLLTYNLYPNFVELGKAFDLVDSNVSDELMKRLQLLVNHLSPGNRQLAGLIFHHLHRVAECQSENQMGAANLGTMFAPTVLRQRPKFQVANMMEFMDNKGQTKVVELLIDHVFHVFGPSEQYDPIKLIIAHITSNDDKAMIADYNQMNTARGSISLAGCERSKSTSGTVPDDIAELRTSLANKTASSNANNDALSSANFPVSNALTGGINHNNSNINNNSNSKGNTSIPPSSSLLRSATISVSSHTRTPGTLLSGALPLYTPFRLNQPSGKDTEDAMNTTRSNVTTASVFGDDKVTMSRIDSTYGKPHPIANEKSSNIRSGVRLQDLAKTTNEPSTNITSPTSNTGTCSGSGNESSVVRGIKKLCATGNQYCTTSTLSMSSNTSSKPFSSPDKHNTSGSKSTASNASSSTDSHTNNTLSGLVIGRRKPIGKLMTVHHTTDGTPTSNRLNLDQYSFIDNDSPDHVNG